MWREVREGEFMTEATPTIELPPANWVVREFAIVRADPGVVLYHQRRGLGSAAIVRWWSPAFGG